MRQRTWGRLILRIVVAGAGVTAVSMIYAYAIHVNSTTAALTYLLFVLGAATLWGLPEAMAVSVMSMLWLDYYFLPPVPALGIQDPENWVAWCAFLITSWVVSELSARLKKRASEAVQRQREIERMYAAELPPDAGQRGEHTVAEHSRSGGGNFRLSWGGLLRRLCRAESSAWATPHGLRKPP